VRIRTRITLAAALVALASVLPAAAAHAQPAAATSPSTAVCYDANHRGFHGRAIDLWQCNNIPGSHGLMYHAEVSHAWAGDVVVIRYRKTNNNAWLDYRGVDTGWDYANTADFYSDDFGNGDFQVQACAHLVDSSFACAWTYDDGNS
jgi:hypothetical protein